MAGIHVGVVGVSPQHIRRLLRHRQRCQRVVLGHDFVADGPGRLTTRPPLGFHSAGSGIERSVVEGVPEVGLVHVALVLLLGNGHDLDGATAGETTEVVGLHGGRWRFGLRGLSA